MHAMQCTKCGEWMSARVEPEGRVLNVLLACESCDFALAGDLDIACMEQVALRGLSGARPALSPGQPAANKADFHEGEI